MNKKRGFVVSAVLYPLLVIFLALIMGLLSMSDVRKRILDRMKLEISDSLFDEASCSCETILNKLNYIIKNGVGCSGGVSGGGQIGGGSTDVIYYDLKLNIKAYESAGDLPHGGNTVGDIAVITSDAIAGYHVSPTRPEEAREGDIWLIQDNNIGMLIDMGWFKVGVSYVLQYIGDEWQIRKAYFYKDNQWNQLYYVQVNYGVIQYDESKIGGKIKDEYDYTGKYQQFTAEVPGYYKVELWGARGGSWNSAGGLGSYTSGEIYLDVGDTLYFYVGGYVGSSNAGGWNGGGNGTTASYNSQTMYGGGGGGATDVRVVKTTSETTWNEFESLKTRIMVAAGGGGNVYYSTGSNYGPAGAGGGLRGINGSGSYGATQASGGVDGDWVLSTNGEFGLGGNGRSSRWGGGGGGGGYNGGGGGYSSHGGSGGSSYISGHEGCDSVAEESTSTNIIYNGSSYNYTGKYFRNTVIIDGQGYKWANERIGTSAVVMPNPRGSGYITGNTSHGYARISLAYLTTRTQKQLEEERPNNEYHFNYSGTDRVNGRYQTFTALKSGIYQVELWGAIGGSWNGAGGTGSYTSGKIYLDKNTKLYMYIGGRSMVSNTGGWNGGGNGTTASYNSQTMYGGGGGGATDVRLVPTSTLLNYNEFESLKTRIMVAAGGGGNVYYTGNESNYGPAGAGGGLQGYNGSGSDGAIQSSGGMDQSGNIAVSGGLGYGGNGLSSRWAGAGGGGGYYGGGGGYNSSGGSGGSSYISGHKGCSSISEDSVLNNVIHTGENYHYSKYYFTDTVMIDGQGYEWLMRSGSNRVGLPTYGGRSTMYGNSDDGYAKITFLSEEEKTKDEINHEILDIFDTWTYEYSGTDRINGRQQRFTASKAGYYKIELWGAQGNSWTGNGGLGGYTKGEIYLNHDDQLYVYVGGFLRATNTGGWNGGGNGTTASYNSQTMYGCGGGGATDIRTVKASYVTTWNDSPSLRSRIMVSGGGGGSVYYTGDGSNYGPAGAGGGLSSYGGSGGTAATQIAAGSYGGGFGYGGVGRSSTWGGGAGGGGWYGGGGGYNSTGGAGGSSYISGHEGCIAVDNAGNPVADTFSDINDSISNTNYKFINTEMVDGNGYLWTSVKANSVSYMPSHDGLSTMVGNSGPGYAKITYIGENAS